MSEFPKNDEHLDAVVQATEALEARLQNNETDSNLVEDFSTLEKSVFMAGQQNTEGVAESLGTLAGYAGRSHQACLGAGYGEGETFFMSKLETYRSMMEAMAARPASEPKPTDTEQRNMSGAKNRI